MAVLAEIGVVVMVVILVHHVFVVVLMGIDIAWNCYAFVIANVVLNK